MNKLPRLFNGKRFVFSRSRILNGDIQVFYGPDQIASMGSFSPYNPPEDWPKAGTLLRCPQVVWLTRNNMNVEVQLLTDQGPDVGAGLPCADETNRLGDVFEAVRNRITRIRGPRTLVNRYHDASDVSGDRISTVLIPQFPDTPYMTTNFLHVYVGYPRTPDGVVWLPYNAPLLISDGSQQPDWIAGMAGTAGGHWHYFSPPEEELESAVEFWNSNYWPSLLERAAEVYQKFEIGYRTCMFSYDVYADPGDYLPSVWSLYPLVQWTHEYVESANNAYKMMFYRYQFIHALWMQQQCDDLNQALGMTDAFEYMGGSSRVTEDYLVSLIAGHFGFDPETGADL